MNIPAPTAQPTRNKAQQDAIDSAMKVIRTIDNLASNDDFKDFMERHSRRADELAQDVLHDDKLAPDEREKVRNRRLGILEVLLSLKEDREAQVRVLAGYGVNPGDPQR